QGRHVVLERRVEADVPDQRRVDGRVLAQGAGRLIRVVERDTYPRHRPEVEGPERETCDDAEVAATAAERPEQLGILLRRGRDDLTGGEHHLELGEIVAGQPVLSGEPADPAAQGEAGDAGLR